MDQMEASCVLSVKVGRFDQFEQGKISVLTITSLVIVMINVHYDLMVSTRYM
jgi:predicted XRE-type DNA-binding protein